MKPGGQLHDIDAILAVIKSACEGRKLSLSEITRERLTAYDEAVGSLVTGDGWFIGHRLPATRCHGKHLTRVLASKAVQTVVVNDNHDEYTSSQSVIVSLFQPPRFDCTFVLFHLQVLQYSTCSWCIANRQLL